MLLGRDMNGGFEDDFELVAADWTITTEHH